MIDDPGHERQLRRQMRHTRHQLMTITVMLAFGGGFFTATLAGAFRITGAGYGLLLSSMLALLWALMWRRRPRD